jgi:peptide/nickel transport system substrate-binding protein
VDRIDATDDSTVVFHLKEPFATLLWNLSDGAIGIVPFGSGDEISSMPIGSGPFRLVSAQLDREIVIERNQDYWGQKARVNRVRFIVVPDTTTRALELRKGSADIAINALTADMILALQRESKLNVLRAPGTVLSYLAFNLRDPILKDVRVRQALAFAIDRRPMLQYLSRGFARPADSVLPPESWAYNREVAHYPYDPERARQLLEQAGYPAVNGVRFHLTMKTSTEESTRLMAAVLQQQLHDVGIVLDIRTFEFATFFSDVTRGAFELYSLRWIGGNEDPDIFEYVFHSARVPPHGANRGYYANPRVDALIDQARSQLDQNTRKRLYAEIQNILAEQLPYINLWYQDNVLVHSKRVRNLTLNPSGNYDFLKTAELDGSTVARQ